MVRFRASIELGSYIQIDLYSSIFRNRKGLIGRSRYRNSGFGFESGGRPQVTNIGRRIYKTVSEEERTTATTPAPGSKAKPASSPVHLAIAGGEGERRRPLGVTDLSLRLLSGGSKLLRFVFKDSTRTSLWTACLR